MLPRTSVLLAIFIAPSVSSAGLLCRAQQTQPTAILRYHFGVSVQLVDAITGAHLWAENYERAFSPEALFELQDDLVPRIVSTVADTQGILPRRLSDILRTKNPSDLSPYEAVLRSFAHFQRVNAEEHAASRAALERAVEVQPGYPDAWAMLSLICKEEFTHELNLRPDPLGRAMAAALRAVEAAPSNHMAFHALAMAQYFLGDRPAFRIAAERAMELNPMDGFSIAFLGSFIAYDGDWEYGCKLSAPASGLDLVTGLHTSSAELRTSESSGGIPGLQMRSASRAVSPMFVGTHDGLEIRHRIMG